MRAFIAMGVFITKNTFEVGQLLVMGTYWKEGAKLNLYSNLENH